MKPYRILPFLLFFLFAACDNSPKKKDINVVEIDKQEIEIETTHKRKALVVGIADYDYADDLNNPENDAKDMADVLKQLGFDVSEYTNLDQDDLRKAIDEFGDNLGKNDIALFFYAGHGIQANGVNFLVPTNAQPKSEADVEYNCVNTERVLAKMETAETYLNIMILDACRNNPFERGWRGSKTRGLASMSAPGGTIIAFATDPGNVASDGDGRNGLFTSKLLRYINQPDITFEKVLKYTGKDVSIETSKEQTPWWNSSYYGDFYMAGKTQKEETPEEETVVKEEENEPIAENTGDIVWQDDKHGTFTDPRDGQSYKVVKIGEQVWMAENLNYTQGIPHITDKAQWDKLDRNNTDAAWCYYENKTENGDKYGALYTYAAALQVAPEGWHLPTKEEFEALLKQFGGAGENAYKALTEGGNSDFNVRYAGWRNVNGAFHWMGSTTSFWSATWDDNTGAWNCHLKAGGKVARIRYDYKSVGLSVRLLRD